jgi:hypothetical protein
MVEEGDELSRNPSETETSRKDLSLKYTQYMFEFESGPWILGRDNKQWTQILTLLISIRLTTLKTSAEKLPDF